MALRTGTRRDKKAFTSGWVLLFPVVGILCGWSIWRTMQAFETQTGPGRAGSRIKVKGHSRAVTCFARPGSRVFHAPDCRYVDGRKEARSFASAQAAEGEGYSACKICLPENGVG